MGKGKLLTIHLMHVKDQANRRPQLRLSGNCGEPYLLSSFGFLFVITPLC